MGYHAHYDKYTELCNCWPTYNNTHKLFAFYQNIIIRELTLRYSLISVAGDRVKRCNVWFIFTLAELPGIAPG